MTTLTGQAQAALIALETRACHTTSTFRLEQIDRALDEVLRLNGTQPTAFQVRSATANAAKVLRDRRRIAPVISLDDPQLGEPGAQDSQIPVIDLRSWLRTTRGLTEGQRRLLTLMAEYDDADTVAAEYGAPSARIRERVSRARRAARTAYAREVTAA
jgi:DNA-directed RNA polymerase specialized sigma24 family protein